MHRTRALAVLSSKIKRRPWRVLGWHVYASTFTVSLAFCGLVTATQLAARKENWNFTSQSAQNLSRAVADDLGRLIESLGLSLNAVAESSRIPGLFELDTRLQTAVLFDQAVHTSSLGYVALLDREGNLVAASEPNLILPRNLADRDFFHYHRDNFDPAIRVSGAFRSVLGNEPVIALSRRIRDSNGAFDGVAVGTIKLDAIRAKFEALHLGPRDGLALFHRNGTLLVRVPSLGAAIGKDISQSDVFRKAMQVGSGQFIAVSPIDGVRRLNVASTIPGAPMVLSVGLSVDDIEARWRYRAQWTGVSTLLVVALLFVVSHLFCLELRRRQAAEAALTESEANYRLLAENSGDMVSRLDPDNVRRYVSPASVRLLGRTPETMVGCRPQEKVHPDDLENLEAALGPVQRGEAEEAIVTYRCQRADGVWIWLEATIKLVHDPSSGRPDGIVAISRDVTERKALEAQLARLASLDGLTGIANRRVFDEALEREWRRCRRALKPISLLLIDVDHFKALNDSQGHQKGDDYLRKVATMIDGSARRAGDMAARYGGEEFALLLPETDVEGAEVIAERLRSEVAALALPHPAGGLGNVVTVSIGVATIWPIGEAHAWPGNLVDAADRCLYQAKHTGRNRVVHSMPATSEPWSVT